MSEDIIFREYALGDEEQINALYEEVFRHQRSRKKWCWEYRDAPTGPASVLLAKESDVLVGHIGFMPYQFLFSGKPVLGGKFEDLMIAGRFRRKGIFGELERRGIEDLKKHNASFAWGISTPAYKTMLKLGYRHLFSLSPYVTMIDPGRVAQGVSVALGFPALKKIIEIPLAMSSWVSKRKLNRAVRHSGGYSIERIERFNAEHDALFEKFIENDQTHTLIRSAAFLNWRFVDNPHREYLKLNIRKDGSLVGYFVATIITREDKISLRLGIINDWLILEGNEDVLPAIFEEVYRYWESAQASVGVCWSDKSRHSRELKMALRKVGFFRSPFFSIPFLFKNIDDIQGQDVSEISQWHITMAVAGKWA